MKNSTYYIFVFLLFSAIIYGCKKKEPGSLHHKGLFTTSINKYMTLRSEQDSLHKGYGDYITSITPNKFSAKILMMFYLDNWDWNSDNMHSVSYTYNGSKELIVDFSNNQETTLEPQLFSRDIIEGEDGSKVFKQKEVTFIYFVFNPWYLYQELNLPSQYENIRLTQFDEYYNEFIQPNTGGTKYNCDSVKIGTKLKSRYAPFISRIFNGEVVNTFIFGNTDSSFVFNKEKNPLQPSKDFPFVHGGSRSINIRSHKFKSVIVKMPDSEQTMTMKSTILFNSENLIQIYAGNDNIPYTGDDIMLYAPKFWERLQVKLDVINQ